MLQTWRKVPPLPKHLFTEAFASFLIKTQEAKIESLCIPKTPGNKRNNYTSPSFVSYQRWTGRAYNPITVGYSLVFSSPWKQTGGVGGPPPRLKTRWVSQGHPMGIRLPTLQVLAGFFPEFFPPILKQTSAKTRSSCQEARAWLVELGSEFSKDPAGCLISEFQRPQKYIGQKFAKLQHCIFL